MIVSYRFRLLPTKAQHRALEQILESQRQLYNAALEERIGAYRKAVGVHDSYLVFEDGTGLDYFMLIVNVPANRTWESDSVGVLISGVQV